MKRYGRVKVATILRDWNALRHAIRSHDTEAIEAAFENVERWAGYFLSEQGEKE